MTDPHTPMTNEERRSHLDKIERLIHIGSRTTPIYPAYFALFFVLTFTFLLAFQSVYVVIPAAILSYFIIGYLQRNTDIFEPRDVRIAKLLASYSPSDPDALDRLRQNVSRTGTFTPEDIVFWLDHERDRVRRPIYHAVQAFIEAGLGNLPDDTGLSAINPNLCADCIGHDRPEEGFDFADTGKCGQCGVIDEVWDLPHLAAHFAKGTSLHEEDGFRSVNPIRNSHISDDRDVYGETA